MKENKPLRIRSFIAGNDFILLTTLLLIINIGIIFIASYPNYDDPDYNGYVSLANAIHSGQRTPVYPALIYLFGNNYTLVIYFQLLLGFITCLIIYSLISDLVNNKYLAFIGAFLFAIYPPLIMSELRILPETLTTFLIILAFFLLFKYFQIRRPSYIFLTALVLCLAALARPLYILMPLGAVLLFIYIIIKSPDRLTGNLYDFAVLILIILFTIGGWSLINYKINNTFGLTTMTGMGMTNAVGNFIENGEKKDDLLVNIYIKYRDKNYDTTGSYVNTIWRAYPEMMEKSGLSYSEVSKKLVAVSLSAIVRNPFRYLDNILNSFINFWNPLPNHISFKSINKIISLFFRVIYLALNLFFFITAFSLFLSKRLKKEISNANLLFLRFMVLSVIFISILQGMVEYGTYRYALPTQPLVIVTTLSVYNYLFCKIKKRGLLNYNNN